MRRLAPAILSIAFVSCGRYSDFALPSPAREGPSNYTKWEQSPAPVLAPGKWDSVDVLNPSIVETSGVYLNLYSGFDGKTWSTGIAISADGLAWIKKGRIIQPEGWEGGYIAANGSAVVNGGEILYWYQAGDPPRIALAKSSDAMKFVKHGAPVLETGPRGSFDERGAADPYVIRSGATYFMFYLGQDRARRQRLGLARSSDGVRWEKLRANPILDVGPEGAFDEQGVGEPAVWSSGGYWWMLYTGRDRGERRRLGLARSADGVQWQRQPLVISGDQPWNSAVMCDPHVEAKPDGVRVWFGGGNAAHPAERVNGRIGAGWLR